jgi:DUF4097 and DUF4098 domain-containing protein YvlB
VSRRADRILALIAGGILSVVFVACSAVNVAGWTTGAVEQKAHRTITGPVDELQIRAGGGDVMLMPARGDDVVIDSRARGSLVTPELEVDVNGYDVAVNGGCREVSFGHCEATLLVQVPAGTAVRVDASSGDLSAEGLNANVSLSTGSGDVRVRRLNGRLDLDTASGDVDGANLRSDSVSASTGSGDVDLDFALPPDTVDADTASGDIRIFVPRGPELYSVDVDTASGDENVDVDRDAGSSRLLKAQTGSGDVEIAYRGS